MNTFKVDREKKGVKREKEKREKKKERKKAREKEKKREKEKRDTLAFVCLQHTPN